MSSVTEIPMKILVRQQPRETTEKEEEHETRMAPEREELLKDLPHSD